MGKGERRRAHLHPEATWPYTVEVGPDLLQACAEGFERRLGWQPV